MKEQDVPLVQALGALLSLSLGVSNEICEQVILLLFFNYVSVIIIDIVCISECSKWRWKES